jgi:hypothetical protein
MCQTSALNASVDAGLFLNGTKFISETTAL